MSDKTGMIIVAAIISFLLWLNNSQAPGGGSRLRAVWRGINGENLIRKSGPTSSEASKALVSPENGPDWVAPVTIPGGPAIDAAKSRGPSVFIPPVRPPLPR